MRAASVRRWLLLVGAVPLVAACTVVSMKNPPATATTSSAPTSARSSRAASDTGPRPVDVRTALDIAAFVTPAGQIVCLLAADGVRCDYFALDKVWQAPRPGNCDIDWGSSLHVDRTAGTSCVGDSIVAKAATDSGFESWRKAGDPTVPWNGLTLAALPYGSTLVLDTFRCDNATDGVTCQNESTGHGFFMSRDSIRIF